VFDEADRLLDMGFENDVRGKKPSLFVLVFPYLLFFFCSAITEELKNKSRAHLVPQTALISATLWDKVMTLASIALKNPITINVQEKHEQEKNGDNQEDQQQPGSKSKKVAVQVIYILFFCLRRLLLPLLLM
jgi:superfamily II DNA/RNA helicase